MVQPSESPTPGRSTVGDFLSAIPLYVQIALAVALGTTLGIVFKSRPFIPGMRFGNADLGELAVLVITMLKALAAPLIFFAVLDAFLRTEITWERGRKLFLFSAMNVTAAMIIGLCVMNVWRPGESWSARLAQATPVSSAVTDDAASALSNPAVAGLESAVQSPGGQDPRPDHSSTEIADRSLTLVESLKRIVPTNVVEPFAEGNLMGLILLAVLVGAGFRGVRRAQVSQGNVSYRSFEHVVQSIFEVLLRVLEWVVRLVPLAVCGALAQSVAESGGEVFQLVGIFLAAICLGLALHAFGYYTCVVWTLGGLRPRDFLGRGFEAVLMGLSTNSSLATVPVTLRVLTEKMGVSDQSARLSACVGTNFNNDGITLYEAMTAIFLAQAAGLQLPVAVQVKVVGMCVLASLGAAGIPHGGLAVLPLVLASSGLSASTIAVAMPLIMTVDWIIARCRSGVNVMGDMTVAIQLDWSRADNARD
jgi:Na+/H+-dicarboxylate symporter